MIQAFVNKLESLDTEISAITLLYEETEKRHVAAEKDETVTFEKLSEISRKALMLHEIRMIRLPPMRVLTSRRKTGEAENLDVNKMQKLFANYGFVPTPSMRDCFMRKEPEDEWIMLMKIPIATPRNA